MSDLSRSELLELFRGPQNSRILSLYLSCSAAGLGRLAPKKALETQARALLRDVGGSVSPQLKDAFAADALRAWQFVSSWQPKMTGLVLFCDEAHGRFWSRELAAPVTPQAYWRPTPYIKPLIEAWDEYEPVGLIFADRKRARLYRLELGELKSLGHWEAAGSVHRPKGHRRDRLVGQKKAGRAADRRALEPMAQAAATIDRLTETAPMKRFLLAGPPWAVHQLFQSLSPGVQRRVAGVFSTSLEAAESRLAAAATRANTSAERAGEAVLVERLIRQAAEGRAAVGLRPTIESEKKGRLHQLVYSASARPRGWICRACGALSDRGGACACGKRFHESSDFLELLVERAFLAGAAIERVEGDGADRLDSEGSIGVFLRGVSGARAPLRKSK